MWRVKELYEAAGLTRDDLLFDFVNGMFYTPLDPTFEQMRDGMLAHLAQSAGDSSARKCAVWRGFAERGIGVGAAGVQEYVGSDWTVSIQASFAMPAECGGGVTGVPTPAVPRGSDGTGSVTEPSSETA